MKHFLAELRRRGVLRVGLVYLAGTWLVVQVLQTLLPVFGLPETIIRWLVIASAVGFIPVLALSWAFEWTAQGIRKESELVRDPAVQAASGRTLDRVVIAVFAVALGYFAFDRFVLEAARNTSTSSPQSIAIAVLPFQTLGPDPGREYFTDGIHEELISRLSQAHGLAVRSRTSVMPFRQHAESLAEIARQLAVGAIVEGSVRHAGDRVRITAKLIDAQTDKLLWSGSFEGALSVQNLFQIQTRAARQIAAALEARLTPEERSREGTLPTRSLEAYDHFLLGKYHYRKLRTEDLRASVADFEAAVALDPEFAPAWDWLAFAHSHSATSMGWLPPSEAYPKARAAALRALELDPGLADSRALLGYLRAVYDWDWPEALADLEHVLVMSPDSSGTVWSYAYVLAIVGRHEEAIELVKRFADTHPEDARAQSEVAFRLAEAGRYQDALERVGLSLSLGGEPGPLHDLAGVALIGLGRYESAVDRLEQAATYQERSQEVLGHLGYAYARLGRLDAARGVLAELQARRLNTVVSPVSLAYVQVGLGNTDEALTLLEQGADERYREVLSIAYSPLLTELRIDPRFKALLARMRLGDQRAAAVRTRDRSTSQTVPAPVDRG